MILFMGLMVLPPFPCGEGVELETRAGLVMQIRVAEVKAHGMPTEGPGDKQGGAAAAENICDDAGLRWASVAGAGRCPAGSVYRDRAFACADGREWGPSIMCLATHETAAVVTGDISSDAVELPDIERPALRATPSLGCAGQDASARQFWRKGCIVLAGKGLRGEGPHISSIADTLMTEGPPLSIMVIGGLRINRSGKCPRINTMCTLLSPTTLYRCGLFCNRHRIEEIARLFGEQEDVLVGA